ncbi:hypothetical protein DPMN_064171 [Dreissena polymorpha]|uniref:Uncharacterized protein n=1 Tax=Dreissena polymorpha TaxID=45954 RepID=A0A9D4CCQ6_DREPO|nr:hypothetical protein DPMN_064171 [Dreissena polymorpha]
MMSYGSGKWMGHPGLGLLQAGLVLLLGKIDINGGVVLLLGKIDINGGAVLKTTAQWVM